MKNDQELIRTYAKSKNIDQFLEYTGECWKWRDLDPKTAGLPVQYMVDVLGLNSPECVTRKLVTFGQNITKILDEMGLDWWIDGGTLLGYERDGQILPWEHDFDISIAVPDNRNPNDLMTCLEKTIKKKLNVTITSLQDAGYMCCLWMPDKRGFGKFEIARAIGYINVDLVLFFKKGDIMNRLTEKSANKDGSYPTDFIYPLKKVRFAGGTFFVPNRGWEYTERNYPGFEKVDYLFVGEDVRRARQVVDKKYLNNRRSANFVVGNVISQ